MTNFELVLLRHGESEWNAKNLFTGWVDVRLSDKGEAEARRGGSMLAERGLLPDVVHTSLLRRAIHTSQLALDTCDRHWIPVKRSWRLNERHYGALQGKDKAQTLAEEIRGIPLALVDLKNYQNGFDVIITCTGADNHIITKEIYDSLLVGESNKKIVIDLAIPQDLDPAIIEKHKNIPFFKLLVFVNFFKHS